MNEFEKAQAEKILSAYGIGLNDLEKGGKGSGRKIGQTSTGKDVYDTFEHEGHKDFNVQEHTDAKNLHNTIGYKATNKKQNYHYGEADKHKNHAESIGEINKAIESDIEKGRKGLPIGTKKTWGGKEYIKTSKGWTPSKDAREAHAKIHGEDKKEEGGKQIYGEEKFKHKLESGKEWDIRNDIHSEKHKDAAKKLTLNDHKALANLHGFFEKNSKGASLKGFHAGMKAHHVDEAWKLDEPNRKKEFERRKNIPQEQHDKSLNLAKKVIGDVDSIEELDKLYKHLVNLPEMIDLPPKEQIDFDDFVDDLEGKLKDKKNAFDFAKVYKGALKQIDSVDELDKQYKIVKQKQDYGDLSADDRKEFDNYVEGLKEKLEGKEESVKLSNKAEYVLKNSLEQYNKSDEKRKKELVKMVEDNLKSHENGLKTIGMGLDEDMVNAGKEFLKQVGK